ncbi:guanine nucleotide-binding protein g(o) subunit alpha [Anaeramoeba flamelloides]|uniref:Guanine nucleotide-binding protein g(O) subunit alpha n=1 Tax=Anaeramoeba flamelloides TaxID=1746091 RepID=A0AAV7YJ84_9EUKA|nr:guanine nucleotide-binding protein g(o) subunit alpha [Anaeramoeba flamelloides]KAJ6247366.1 guanine nucleotide-binding protein g(o) subunit alpha [Anaeramoeba flamelloides]
MGKNNSKRKNLKKQAKKNKRIEKQLSQQNQQQDQEVKILLLGTGDSGKSTIVKQIQILYKGGFTENDLLNYKNVIRSNIKFYIKTLIKSCSQLGLKISEKNAEIAEDFVRTVKKSSVEITEQVRESILALWKDPILKEAYERRYEYQLPDASKYFLDRANEICKEDYMPIPLDILNCRIATVGVKEIQFEVSEHIWRIVDVGGQRSERRKWIHQFDDVSILIFVVATSEYNQSLYEDERINRMQESLKVFKKTVNNEFFKKKDLVILLNKIDLFKEKIKKYPLTKCFPEYKGDGSFEQTSEYVKMKYMSTTKKKGRTITPHYTCATNTDLTKNVIETVMNNIIETNINKYF